MRAPAARPERLTGRTVVSSFAATSRFGSDQNGGDMRENIHEMLQPIKQLGVLGTVLVVAAIATFDKVLSSRESVLAIVIGTAVYYLALWLDKRIGQA